MTETLGAYLKRIRLQRKLTLRAVEVETGIPNAHLSQLETGRITKPSPDTLHKLAEFYEIQYHYLMKLAGYPTLIHTETRRGQLEVSSRIGRSLRDLTKDELERVLEYAEFLRSKRVKK